MTENTITKICTKCQEPKLLTEFSKWARSKDGLSSWCKHCKKGYRQVNKDVVLAYNKAYREANKESIAVQVKGYQLVNKETISAHKKEYREANKETISEYQKEYRHANSDAISEYKKEYYQTEAGKNTIRKAHHKRRALKQKVMVEDFPPIEIFERDGYVCQLCRKKTRPDYKNSFHPLYPNLDHIIPLSKGGSHTKKNTQCLCRKCNAIKHNTGVGDQLRMFG